MTIEEIEDLAFCKAPMPDLDSQADILAFQSFRSLYDFAARVSMSPEQGKREKAQIVHAHRISKALEELQNSTNRMWKRIEITAAEYCKNPCVETADRLYTAIYGAKRKKESSA